MENTQALLFEQREIIRYRDGRTERLSDPVIRESWYELSVNNAYSYHFPALDRDIEEAVYGVLFLEGYLRRGDRIEIRRAGRELTVELPGEVERTAVRDMIDCAISKIELGEDIVPLPEGSPVPADRIIRLVNDFQRLPSMHRETGGVHTAALARESIRFWADDISRRTAIDKAVGKGFLAEEDFPSDILISSGRISSDMAVRAMRAGIPVVVSVSAPTDRALEIAEAYGICVCGYVRGGRMNVYTRSGRIDFTRPEGRDETGESSAPVKEGKG